MVSNRIYWLILRKGVSKEPLKDPRRREGAPWILISTSDRPDGNRKWLTKYEPHSQKSPVGQRVPERRRCCTRSPAWNSSAEMIPDRVRLGSRQQALRKRPLARSLFADEVCPVAAYSIHPIEIDFFGSKKGLGTTVAERIPTSVSTVAVCPNSEKPLATNAKAMFLFSLGE